MSLEDTEDVAATVEHSDRYYCAVIVYVLRVHD